MPTRSPLPTSTLKDALTPAPSASLLPCHHHARPNHGKNPQIKYAPDMAQQHQAQPFALPLPQAQSLLTHFTAFLTTALHTLLYHRNLYPPATFLTTRSHNLPVHQSRHPAVCSWIAAAVSSVRDQLLAGSVEKVVFVVHSPPSVPSAKTSPPPDAALESQPELVVAVEEEEVEPRPGVVERWVFDVSSFPAFAGPGELDKKKQKKSDAKGKGKEREPDGGGCDEGEEEEVAEEEGSVNWVDVEEQFRGALGRISHAGEKLGALPKGCTFTVAVELRDDAPVPVEVSLCRVRIVSRFVAIPCFNSQALREAPGLHLPVFLDPNREIGTWRNPL